MRTEPAALNCFRANPRALTTRYSTITIVYYYNSIKLTDGRVLTGAVKWNARPLEARWHLHHLRALDRLAQSGVKWAHLAAQENAPLLYVAAGGFTPEFKEVARASRPDVMFWTLTELFRPRTRPHPRLPARRP